MLLSEVGIMCVQAENTKENNGLGKRHRADCPKEALGTPTLLTPPPWNSSPGREAALCWASLPKPCPASSVRAREGAGCGSVGAVSGA